MSDSQPEQQASVPAPRAADEPAAAPVEPVAPVPAEGEPSPDGGTVAVAAAPVKSGRFRRLLPVLIVSAVVLISAVATTGVLLYQQATEPDRSTPVTVVDQFLQAALVDKSVTRVGLFVCKEWPPEDALNQVLPKLDPSVKISWGATSVSQTGKETVDVTVHIEYGISKGSAHYSQVDTWILGLVKQSGWRVCAMRRDASLSPN